MHRDGELEEGGGVRGMSAHLMCIRENAFLLSSLNCFIRTHKIENNVLYGFIDKMAITIVLS